MSTYQADWFLDEKGNVDFENKLDCGSVDDNHNDNDDHDGDDIDLAGLDEAIAMDEDNDNIKTQKQVQFKSDLEFPDEVDTPHDISARKRFVKYRALQSFRASPWHPKENLPLDYAKIFQFENFNGNNYFPF